MTRFQFLGNDDQSTSTARRQTRKLAPTVDGLETRQLCTGFSVIAGTHYLLPTSTIQVSLSGHSLIGPGHASNVK